MALRLCQLMLHRKSPNLLVFSRASHIGSDGLRKIQYLKNCSQDIHLTSTASYPEAKNIPLPTNVEDINAIETGRFSPQRARDITGDVILTHSSSGNKDLKQDLSADSFLESYDCTGTVSLNSSMQTNVPHPYTSTGKASHLNMPGGEWGRSDKYVAQDLQNSHYASIKERDHGVSSRLHKKKGTYFNLHLLQALGGKVQHRQFSSNVKTHPKSEANPNKLDKVAELKKAVQEYGATVIVFHVGISLISLGGFYLAVTSGINMTGLFPSEDLSAELSGQVGSFVVAYAIHKMFAPVRVGITLFATPFIVRHLRKIGILAKPR